MNTMKFYRTSALGKVEVLKVKITQKMPRAENDWRHMAPTRRDAIAHATRAGFSRTRP